MCEYSAEADSMADIKPSQFISNKPLRCLANQVGFENSSLLSVRRQSSHTPFSNCSPICGNAPQMWHDQPFSTQRFSQTVALRLSGFSVLIREPSQFPSIYSRNSGKCGTDG